MAFSESQLKRYNRQIILQELGIDGQSKLYNSKVLVIGAGGLGSPVLLYLAAAGVGTIGIVDNDIVDISNLQRQIIHSTANIGIEKVKSAKQKILDLNPDTNVIEIHERLTEENASEIIDVYDFVVEATDNFESKFLVNDVCVQLRKPFSQGGVFQFTGQTFTYIPGNACYRCIYQSAPPTDKSQIGIIGSIAGVIGSIQATETLKYLTQTGTLLTNKLLTFDALNSKWNTLSFLKDSDCPICGSH